MRYDKRSTDGGNPFGTSFEQELSDAEAALKYLLGRKEVEPEVLAEIDMVGTDFALDPGMGMCGKGQSARVSVGQPTIRIPRLTVGGTDEAVTER